MKLKSNLDSLLVDKLRNVIATYTKQIFTTPQDANLYYLKAEVLTKLAEYEKNGDFYFGQAAECYKMAIELEPQNPLFFKARSKLYLKMGDVTNFLIDDNKAERILKKIAADNICNK